MKRNVLAIGILALSFFGCGEKANSGDQKDQLSEIDLLNDNKQNTAISDSLIQTLNSIPSPIETAFQIKENGVDYNGNYLNSPNNYDQYETSSVLALNLGIYSADLAYCNIYESPDATSFLGAVYEVAKPLGLESHFDVDAMMDLMKSENSNLDSMLQVTTEKFEEINKQLQEDDKSHFSVLMLSGGWLEGLHLLTSVYQQNPSEAVRERIGEQKIVLSQLVSLVSFYKEKDATINKVFSNFAKLGAIYDDIKIERSENDTVEIIMDAELGIPIAVPQSTSTIVITDEHINKIIALVEETRNFITTQN